jgi:hypothetical protein
MTSRGISYSVILRSAMHRGKPADDFGVGDQAWLPARTPACQQHTFRGRAAVLATSLQLEDSLGRDGGQAGRRTERH